MSLVRFLYDLRPFARSPWARRWDNYGLLSPAELQAFFQPHFKIEPSLTSDEITPPTIGKDGFKVSLNMRDFQPDEIVVKTVDNAIVVEGKYERKDKQNGTVYSEFLRKYMLPEEFDPEKVESSLTSDGILTITAPAPPKNERVVKVNRIEDAKETKKDE